MKSTEDYDNLEAGLEKRGFVGISEIDSMAYCHKDFKHWLLRTDGLIIYTNYPWTHNKARENQIEEHWGMEEFTFDKLEEIIQFVEEEGIAKEIIPEH